MQYIVTYSVATDAFSYSVSEGYIVKGGRCKTLRGILNRERRRLRARYGEAAIIRFVAVEVAK